MTRRKRQEGNGKLNNISQNSLLKSQNFNFQSIYVSDKINKLYITQEHREPMKTD